MDRPGTPGSKPPTKSWLFSLTLLLIVLLIVGAMSTEHTTASSADQPSLPCPADLAGQFVGGAGFGWYRYFGENTFSPDETLEFSFSIVPSGLGSTLVALDEVSGRTGFQFHFTGGLVNGSVPYLPDEWNLVQIELRFDSKDYVLHVNGVPGPPTPFDFGGSSSVQALRVHFSGVISGTVAWFDTIAATRVSESTQVALLNETFDTGAVYAPSSGTITALQPPETFGTPALCAAVTVLDTSPATLEFSVDDGAGNPAPQSFWIMDNGISPLPWTAEESISWATLDTSSGMTPAEVQVSVDTASLGVGVYSGQITVSSSIAEMGSPQVIYTVLTVYPAGTVHEPCPELRAGHFMSDYYEYLGEHTFAVTDVLEFSFSIVPSASGMSLVAIDEVGGATRYQLYFYNGTVYDGDHGNNFENDIPLSAYNQGEWNTVRAEYDFATQEYMLYVNGIGTGPWPMESYSPEDSVQALRVHGSTWLDTLTIKRQGGVAAIYSNDFDGGVLPGDFALPAPCLFSDGILQVSPTELWFTAEEGGVSPAPQSILIDNGESGSLSWTSSESVGWLSLSSSGGGTPSTVDVSVDTNSLSAGQYGGPVSIFAGDAQGSPQTVIVHVDIEPSEEIPGAHINLTADSGYDNILLDWNPTNNPNVVSYRVMRVVSGTTVYTPVATTVDTVYLDTDPALTSGSTYCYLVEALLHDDTIIRESNVACAVFGEVEIWVPNVWAASGQTRIVPVNIRNATGLRIVASDIWIDFDAAVIEIVDVSETPLTADYTWAYSIGSSETMSRVQISAYETSPPTLYGEGALFWLTVRAVGTEADESPLELQEFVDGVGGSTIYTPDDLFNPVPLRLQSGAFHIAEGGVLGDLNRNGVVQAVDAYIALQVASGALEPTVEHLVSGDVNCNSTVDAADASMILYYSVHGAWPVIPPPGGRLLASRETNGDVWLSISDAIGMPGDIVTMTLQAEGMSDWAGGEFILVYDASVVDGVLGVTALDLASGFAAEYHDDGMGLLHFALASEVPVSGSGQLARISLHISSDALGSGIVPLALAEADLSDLAGRDFATSALQRTIVRQSGSLQIGYLTYLPLFLK